MEIILGSFLQIFDVSFLVSLLSYAFSVCVCSQFLIMSHDRFIIVCPCFSLLLPSVVLLKYFCCSGVFCRFFLCLLSYSFLHLLCFFAANLSHSVSLLFNYEFFHNIFSKFGQSLSSSLRSLPLSYPVSTSTFFSFHLLFFIMPLFFSFVIFAKNEIGRRFHSILYIFATQLFFLSFSLFRIRHCFFSSFFIAHFRSFSVLPVVTNDTIVISIIVYSCLFVICVYLVNVFVTIITVITLTLASIDCI